VWHNHGEVEPQAIGAESDKNEDEDQMDEMITHYKRIGLLRHIFNIVDVL
jgi:hypothetical protein